MGPVSVEVITRDNKMEARPSPQNRSEHRQSRNISARAEPQSGRASSREKQLLVFSDLYY